MSMKTPVKILVIDDDEDDFFIIKEYIKEIGDLQFIIDWCGTYKEGIKKISNKEYNLYFVDYLLGAKTGLDVIKEAIENKCDDPIILLTGNGNRAIDMKAMEYGAVDYLVKSDLNAEKIERCIRYSLERTASLRALRNNEIKYRNIFERSKDTVFVANEELFFIDVNDAALKLFECSREDISNHSIYDFMVSDADVSYFKRELLSKELILDKATDLRTLAAGIKNCIITISGETDANGRKYYQGIVHEITALKKAEKANLALEKMKMASRLVRTMAHEIRNPLNNIMLALEQFRSTADDDENLYREIIGRNCTRISDLITQLVHSSRPGEILLQKKTLQSILDESIDMAGDRINLQNVQLKKEYINDQAWVMADHEKLKIAFVNIIINAVEAMQKDSGQLMISVKDKSDVQYAVSIEDNGSGITNENLMKLFEPYFTTKQNGLGLGLASTLNILQSHNASVDVDSEIKKGTVFKLFFNKA